MTDHFSIHSHVEYRKAHLDHCNYFVVKSSGAFVLCAMKALFFFLLFVLLSPVFLFAKHCCYSILPIHLFLHSVDAPDKSENALGVLLG
jgi:hypothetical protein